MGVNRNLNYSIVGLHNVWNIWGKKPCSSLQTTTPNNLFLIRSCYKKSFTCKEYDIFQTLGTHLISVPSLSCVIYRGCPVQEDCIIQQWNQVLFLHPEVITGFIFLNINGQLNRTMNKHEYCWNEYTTIITK